MPPAQRSRLLALAKRRSVVTAAEVAGAGIHSEQLTRLVADGVLERIARGQYRLVGRSITEHHGLAIASHSAPKGVICLLSALAFHGVGTQVPAEVWIAIARRARAPLLRSPRLRVIRYSGAAFTEGMEIHRVEGQHVAIYSVAKTLADLFKHRNKVGLDVAIEALRDAWRERKFTMEDLDRAARVCRVTRIIQPYVETVIS